MYSKFSLFHSLDMEISVSNIVEFLGSGLGRQRTINFELNGATWTSEAATEAGRTSVKI